VEEVAGQVCGMPIGFPPSLVWSADTDCGDVSPVSIQGETVDCEDGRDEAES